MIPESLRGFGCRSLEVAAHFAYLSVVRSFECRMGAGNGSQANSSQIGVEPGCQQGFQSLDALLELFVFSSELVVLLGDLSNEFRQIGDPICLLSDRQIPRIDLWWYIVRHHEHVTNPSIFRNPNRKWAAMRSEAGVPGREHELGGLTPSRSPG